MARFLVLIRPVALALTVPSLAFSQAATPAPPTEPSLRTFLSELADDVRRLPSNPVAVSVTLGAIASSSSLPLDDFFTEWQPNDAFESGTWIGNGVVLATGTLLTYATGHWADMPRAKRIAADLLRAQVLSLGLAYGLKYATHRERPDRSSHDSFPSGHAAQTFASAMALGRHLGRSAAVPAFAAATFVSFSRVNQRRHHLSDVAFGAGLGAAVGWTSAHRASRWTIQPSVMRSTKGIQISRVFAR